MKKVVVNVGQAVNKLLAPVGFQIVRYIPTRPGGYILAKETLDAAARNNQSVTEYVETLWNEQGLVQQVIDRFREFGALNPSTKRVCEIGTGTGIFAEAILKSYDISQYESYEIAQDWAEWLSQTYTIISHPTTGNSLDSTESNSIDLVHANGVFVYTPFLVTCKYFLEFTRVTKSGGFAVFDILSEDCFNEELLTAWLSSPHSYPCILPKDYVKTFFLNNGFSYIGEFLRKFGEGKSVYLIFQKR